MVKTNNTKQSFWIFIGQLASMMIAIISPMILSRYLTKMDYGTYKQVMYVYVSFLSIFTLGLPKSYSYFIPKVPLDEIKCLINKITLLFFILGSVFSSFLFCGSSIISCILKNPDLDLALRIFSIVPLLLLPTIGIEGIYASFQKTHIVAVYTVVTKLITLLLTIIPVVLFNGSYIHAIIGFDIGCFVTFIVALYLKNYPVKNEKTIKTHISYSSIFRFSVPLMIASLWSMIINASDQFYISRYFGNEAFAEYSNGFIEFPVITMLVGSISTVLIPLFSKYIDDNGSREILFNTWKSTMTKSLKIIYPIAFFCICFSSIIMVCMYGNSYSNSAIFFSIKNIQGLFSVIPFTPLILALGMTKEYSLAHMKTALLVVFLEYIAILIFNSTVSIACVSLFCQFLKVVFQLFIILSVFNFSLKDIIDVKTIVLCIVVSLLSSIITLCVNLFVSVNMYFLLFIDLVVYLCSYYILCYIFNISYKDILLSFIGDKNTKQILRYIP